MPFDLALVAPADPAARDALLAACTPGRLVLVAAETGTGGAQLAASLERWLRGELRTEVLRHEKRAPRDIEKISAMLNDGAVVVSVCFLGPVDGLMSIPDHGFAELCGRLAAVAAPAPGIRVLCPSCARPAAPLGDAEASLLARWGIAPAAARRPGPGCPACAETPDYDSSLETGIAGIRSTMPFCAFDDTTRALPPDVQMARARAALAPRSGHERMLNARQRADGGFFPWSALDDLRARVAAGLFSPEDALAALRNLQN